jgi:hypothetical protein
VLGRNVCYGVVGVLVDVQLGQATMQCLMIIYQKISTLAQHDSGKKLRSNNQSI